MLQKIKLPSPKEEYLIQSKIGFKDVCILEAENAVKHISFHLIFLFIHKLAVAQCSMQNSGIETHSYVMTALSIIVLRLFFNDLYS